MNEGSPFANLEVFPGFTIEFDQTARKLAGVRGQIKPREKRQIPTHRYLQLITRIMNDEERRNRKELKYPRVLLDEAVALKRVTSTSHAVEKTGVPRWHILEHERRLELEKHKTMGAVPVSKHLKYTVAQKKTCILLALQLMATGHYSRRQAFKQAGERSGVNGLSIEYQWYRGYVPGVPELNDMAQHPSKALAVLSGASTAIASPQAHL